MDTAPRPQTFRVIGRRTPKVDALDKVTGRAQFGADIALPHMLMDTVPIVPPETAIVNAIYRATGVRPRELPMTAERLNWALKQAQEM